MRKRQLIGPWTRRFAAPKRGPVYIVVTAATLPILAECQERGGPWTERPQARSDTAIGQKRRVPPGCGENRPVRRSAQPYFPIRFSRFSCHRTIFAHNAAREDYVNRAGAPQRARQVVAKLGDAVVLLPHSCNRITPLKILTVMAGASVGGAETFFVTLTL